MNEKKKDIIARHTQAMEKGNKTMYVHAIAYGVLRRFPPEQNKLHYRNTCRFEEPSTAYLLSPMHYEQYHQSRDKTLGNLYNNLHPPKSSDGYHEQQLSCLHS